MLSASNKLSMRMSESVCLASHFHNIGHLIRDIGGLQRKISSWSSQATSWVDLGIRVRGRGFGKKCGVLMDPQSFFTLCGGHVVIALVCMNVNTTAMSIVLVNINCVQRRVKPSSMLYLSVRKSRRSGIGAIFLCHRMVGGGPTQIAN